MPSLCRPCCPFQPIFSLLALLSPRNFPFPNRFSAFKPSRFDDGYLEVVAISGVLHLGRIRVGLDRPLRLAQAKEVRIRTKSFLPGQVRAMPGREEVGHRGAGSSVVCCESKSVEPAKQSCASKVVMKPWLTRYILWGRTGGWRALAASTLRAHVAAQRAGACPPAREQGASAGKRRGHFGGETGSCLLQAN